MALQRLETRDQFTSSISIMVGAGLSAQVLAAVLAELPVSCAARLTCWEYYGNKVNLAHPYGLLL